MNNLEEEIYNNLIKTNGFSATGVNGADPEQVKAQAKAIVRFLGLAD